MKKIILFLISINLYSFEMDQNSQYLGYRHLHIDHSHRAMKYMEAKDLIEPFISKGRVNVFKLKKQIEYKNLPKYVQMQFFPIVKSDLIFEPDASKFKNLVVDKKITKEISKISKDSYSNYIQSLVKLGDRNKIGAAVEYVTTEFTKIGLKLLRSDYNVVSFLEGTTAESIVIIGHMDTVPGTVGADDNASGASGVLELARVLSNYFEDSQPKYNIYFVVSENEEEGLLGAKRFVELMKKENKLEQIKLSINMDMIAYNQNNIVDLETSKKNKDLALYFAERAAKYTNLKSNLVLNPWGSDHIPFLDAGVPAILTIENWTTHTPCWHKACDTIETVNIDYALEILKLNAAVILDLNK